MYARWANPLGGGADDTECCGGGEILFRKQMVEDPDWRAKTLSAMRAQRWAERVAGLTQVRGGALCGLTAQELRHRIECGWQAVPCKPVPTQQEEVALRVVLDALPRQVDCLSIQEHSLVERLLVEDGCSELEELEELEAAYALRHRLWADVGRDGDSVQARLDSRLMDPLRAAMARPEHAATRMRLFSVHATISGLLYVVGALDDRAPQQLFMEQVLQADPQDEEAQHLAQQFLWSTYDCVDYPEGVLLVHAGWANPLDFVTGWHARPAEDAVDAAQLLGGMQGVLPVEEPLDATLEALLQGALRPSQDVGECVREMRLLAKQGAPLEALHHVLASKLSILETPAIRRAVRTLWEGVPRWQGAYVGEARAVH